MASGIVIAVPEPVNVPDLMTCADGTKVTTKEQWEAKRRPEILEVFRSQEYGRRPVGKPEGLEFKAPAAKSALDGKGLSQVVTVSWKGLNGPCSFDALVVKPAKPVKKAPVFICVGWKDSTHSGYLDYNAPKDRDSLPLNDIIARGYAAVMINYTDIAPDEKTQAFQKGAIANYAKSATRDPDGWGTISAWSWGASRVLDWIETQPDLDAAKVAIVGHSRCGKTAMWCACEDTRFAMTCINNSGCSGAKLCHIDLPHSESIEVISRVFPHWFCPNYRAYARKETTLPFDQHWALALVAPRLVCVASATGDDWAGQRGEYWTARLASPAWELYGLKGLVTDGFPKPETPQQAGYVSYHLRTGKHSLSRYDWQQYLNFAAKHGW